MDSYMAHHFKHSTRLYILRTALEKGEIEKFWDFSKVMIEENVITLTEVEKIHNEYY